MSSLNFYAEHDRIADIWDFDDDLKSNKKKSISKSKKPMRTKRTYRSKLNAKRGKSKSAKESRQKVYESLEANKSIKGERGRRLIKSLAKKAHKEGNKELSRGLWAIHTRRSAFAAGVKAASKRKKY